MSTPDKPLNLNTVFLAVLLALSGWTINKVSSLGEQMSAYSEKSINITAQIAEIRVRLTALELRVQANQIELAKLK